MPVKNILFLVLVGVILSVGCSKVVESADKKAPDFSLQDVNDRVVRLSNYENKVIILNFFATWCPPCKTEIPDFIELINEYGDEDFIIIGISVEREKETIKDFVNQYNINYPILLDNGAVSNTYGPISSIPTTFIIDKKGYITQKIIGSRKKDYFESIIKSLL